ncbi:response regulator transcription factor [Allopusillimonas ginsengisoli]|uniref:response regulator transcription factor n=1 Tax=Allopusillimonas ginsengisoli TaxID=453575 RepID=UPI0010228A45|nr:response regulator transcription factor [Allopusillimonas ginsengisoli]TEA72271.1 response regulator transcription factor [Allopusillimonas ginsengisoli]
MWKCLIIEDDRDNAHYVAEGFRELGHHPVVCYDGVEGLRRATTEQWDVIILDRMLPNQIDGLAILTTLRSLGKKVPVLVLSALTTLDERVRGLKSGGDDYLVKPFALMELLARTEALIRRSKNDQSDLLLEYADLRMDLTVPRVTRGGKVIALQPREYRLLSYMMMHPEQTLTRAMLLGSVWGYQFNPQTNVIDAAISRLRQKIDGAYAPPWLIHTVRGAGYMLAERDHPSGNTRNDS